MAMLGVGGMESAIKAGGLVDPDKDGDNDQLVKCPSCGAQFAPGDTDNDAAQMAQGQPPAQQATPDTGTCPECGAKMEGGKCPSCGYSATNSPMASAADRYLKTRPEGERPALKDVVDQGRRVREHMRRPAPYGRP